MFIGSTVFEKIEMITCKISKLHNCPNKQLLNFARFHCIFLKYCATEELEIFCIFCIFTLIKTFYKKNFMFLSRTVLEKNEMIICKISKLFIRTIVQL